MQDRTAESSPSKRCPGTAETVYMQERHCRRARTGTMGMGFLEEVALELSGHGQGQPNRQGEPARREGLLGPVPAQACWCS